MKQHKRNRFFTFIFSLIPGAAEMYMGFMKSGLSIMALFTLVAVIAGNSRLLFPLGAVDVLIWFYAFFHARNLYYADDETFMEIRDDYVWNEILGEGVIDISGGKLRRYSAVALIVTGCFMIFRFAYDALIFMIPDEMWEQVSYIVRDVPEAILAVLFVIGGAKLIKGRKAADGGLVPEEAAVVGDEAGEV